MALGVVSYLAGLDRYKAEDILVEFARPIQIVDFQGNMDNAIHSFSS